MKSLLLTLTLATAAVSTSQAQYYRPSVVRDTTVLGAVAGALIGGHNNDHWAQGAVIGAAAGALIGSAIDDSGPRYQSREIRQVEMAPCAPVYGSAPAVGYGYPPAVVYAPAPRVVYVQPYPRTIIVGRPGVYITDNRYYGHGYRGHDHRRDRRDNRRW
ncbi:MAG: YMGG-like glycine zipper-containing protein [Opitutus sp.]